MTGDQRRAAVRSLVGLRRAERLVSETVRPELAAAREVMEEIVGRTISRAEAARLLEVSQTALDRWIDKGAIAAVLTPQGRREIPLSDLLALLDDVDDVRQTATRRPLAKAIHERERRVDQLDVVGLLPRDELADTSSHRPADVRSLVYHRLVAKRLDEQLVEDARRRLRRWRKEGRISDGWADEWERQLALPLPRLRREIGADTPRARELRQTSPFAGALDEQERRRVLETVAAHGFR